MGRHIFGLIWLGQKRRREENRGKKSKEEEEEEEEGEDKKIQVCVCLGIMGIWIIKVWYGELVSPLV